MFGKIIVWAYNKYSTKLRKKYENAQKDTKKAKEIEFYQNLQSLYKFVQWLNRNFVNRKERKIFWKHVSKGEKVVDSVIQNLLRQYKQKEINEKQKKEAEKNVKEKTI